MKKTVFYWAFMMLFNISATWAIPTVLIQDATNITHNSAVFRGQRAANNPSIFWFEYQRVGQSDTLRTDTSATWTGPLTSYSQFVSGLMPNMTNYEYWLVGFDLTDSTIRYSPHRSFMTDYALVFPEFGASSVSIDTAEFGEVTLSIPVLMNQTSNVTFSVSMNSGPFVGYGPVTVLGPGTATYILYVNPSDDIRVEAYVTNGLGTSQTNQISHAVARAAEISDVLSTAVLYFGIDSVNLKFKLDLKDVNTSFWVSYQRIGFGVQNTVVQTFPGYGIVEPIVSIGNLFAGGAYNFQGHTSNSIGDDNGVVTTIQLGSLADAEYVITSTETETAICLTTQLTLADSAHVVVTNINTSDSLVYDLAGGNQNILSCFSSLTSDSLYNFKIEIAYLSNGQTATVNYLAYTEAFNDAFIVLNDTTSGLYSVCVDIDLTVDDYALVTFDFQNQTHQFNVVLGTTNLTHCFSGLTPGEAGDFVVTVNYNTEGQTFSDTFQLYTLSLDSVTSVISSTGTNNYYEVHGTFGGDVVDGAGIMMLRAYDSQSGNILLTHTVNFTGDTTGIVWSVTPQGVNRPVRFENIVKRVYDNARDTVEAIQVPVTMPVDLSLGNLTTDDDTIIVCINYTTYDTTGGGQSLAFILHNSETGALISNGTVDSLNGTGTYCQTFVVNPATGYDIIILMEDATGWDTVLISVTTPMSELMFINTHSASFVTDSVVAIDFSYNTFGSTLQRSLFWGLTQSQLLFSVGPFTLHSSVIVDTTITVHVSTFISNGASWGSTIYFRMEGDNGPITSFELPTLPQILWTLDDVTNLTAHTATINIYVNPNGNSGVSVKGLWGIQTSEDNESVMMSVLIAGVKQVGIDSLVPNTAYQYKWQIFKNGILVSEDGVYYFSTLNNVGIVELIQMNPNMLVNVTNIAGQMIGQCKMNELLKLNLPWGIYTWSTLDGKQSGKFSSSNQY